MSLECLVLQCWVKNVHHKQCWEMQAWSSLGWGNWIQVFHFPGKCCSHFSLHSRQIAAQQPLVPPLNLSEDPAPRGVDHRCRDPCMGPKGTRWKTLETSEWGVVPTHAPCSDPGAKHGGMEWAWATCRHLLLHGLDHLEGHLGSVLTQLCLSPSSDASDHYHS